MAAGLYDMVQMTVSGTPGTGTITLGLAVAGYQSFASAGVPNGSTVSYTVRDTGNVWESGHGVYNSTAGTLTRGPLYSSSAGSAVTLSAAAIVSLVVLSEDLDQVGIYAQGNTLGVATSLLTDVRSQTLVGQGLVSVGMSGNSILLGASSLAQTNQTLGLYGVGNTTGQSSSSTRDARSLSIDGAGIVSVGMSNGSLIVSAPSFTQSTQPYNIVSASGNTTGTLTSFSAGTLVLAGGNNITLSQSSNTITIVGATAPQTVQTYNVLSASGNTTGTLTSFTTGTIVLAGGNNITFSQSSNTITISGPNPVVQSNQTLGLYGSSQTVGQSSSTTIDARSLTIVGQGLISAGMSGGSLLIAASTAMSQMDFNILSASGNTTGTLTTFSNATLVLAGGNNITLSQSSNTITISGPNTVAQTVQPANILSASGNTTGTLTTFSTGTLVLAGGNNIVLSQSSNSITISGSNQLGDYNILSASGNTTGTLTSFSTGTLVLAGGNNITLSQSSNSITISGPNTIAQSNQTLGLYASSQTVGQSSSTTLDARSITVVGQGIVSAGMSAGSLLISASAAQTLQSYNVLSASGNTTGTLTVFTTGTIVLAGGNNITLSQSSNTITISGPNTVAQTVQPANILSASGNTTGTLTSFSTGTIVLAGGNNITLSQSSNTVTISAASQTNQSLGVYASSQTVGQSSSTTLDARSFTHVGQGIVSVGLSAGSLIISATTAAQSTQTYNVLSASGNTTGTLTTFSTGTIVLAGGNNITLSQSSNSITISGPNTVAQTIQSYNILSASGNTTGTLTSFTTGTVVLAGGNNITLSQSSNTITISGPNTVAQTNQTIGLYASSQTVGQSSSTTLDARSLTIVGQGIISAGLSAGSLLISAVGGGGGDGVNIVSASGNTTGTLTTYSTGTIVLAGGNNITLSQSSNTITISANAEQVNVISASGNTTGTLTTYSTGTIILAGGNNITLSQSSNTITISANAEQVNVISASGNTTGTLTTYSTGTIILAGGNNITLSQSSNTITISGPNTVAQTIQSYNVLSASGNTTGTLTTFSTGTVVLAGGNNIVLSQSSNSITISASNYPITAISSVGAAPNASGATISNQQLVLEPASTSFPGLMTAAQVTKLAGLVTGPSGWIDVTQQGSNAVLTSNTAATNNTNLAAIMTAAPSSSTLYFPPGFYPFASNIAVPAKIFVFRGAGAGLSGTQTGFEWTSNVAGDLITLTAGNWFTQFIDITFLCSVTQTAGAVVNVNNNANINFYRCAFTGLSTSATLFNCINFNGAAGGNQSIVDYCTFTNFTSTGIIFNNNASSSVVRSCVMNGAAIAACGINIIIGGAIQIDDCDIIGCTNNLLINPITSTVVASVWVTNTYFDSSGGSCVKITGAGATVRTKFVECSFTVSASASPANAVEVSSTYAYSTTGMGLDFVSCNVLNTFGSVGVGTGFNITGAADFSIVGCNIAAWATGIAVTPASSAGMTRPNIQNNFIGACGGYAGNTLGISLLAGSLAYGQIIIQGNNFTGNTTNITDASTLGTTTAATGQKSIIDNAGLIVAPPANYTATTIPLTTVTNVDSRGGIFIPIGAGNGSGSFRGATVRITVRAINSASVQTLTATVRYGTTNSNSDAAVFTQAFTAGTAAVGSGTFVFEIGFITTTTLDANMRFYNGNNAATGIAANISLFAGLSTLATIATTANNWLGVYFSSATASAIVVHSVSYEVLTQ